MHSPKKFYVDLKNSLQVCKRLSDRLLYFEMDQYCPRDLNVIDTHGRFWMLAFARVDENELAYIADGTKFVPGGLYMVFVPPFSIIQWKMRMERFKWVALVSDVDLPPDLPQEAVLFRGPHVPPPGSIEEIFEYLRHKPIQDIISKQGAPNSPGRRVKDLINRSFSQPTQISNIMRTLGLSHAFATRTFKKDYGLSPKQYINKVRAFQAALELLLYGSSVHETGPKVGFGEISRFQKEFKKYFNGTPGEFRFLLPRN